MAESITSWLESRLTVVDVRPATGLVRVKGLADACDDLACGRDTVVVASEGAEGGLEALNPGDIIRLERSPGAADRIVVVRRVWDELTSPEF
jgi:hypothetical protein